MGGKEYRETQDDRERRGEWKRILEKREGGKIPSFM